jgi:hypothetical protein
VLQNAYEPIQVDETGNVCGMLPTLGLDVHQKLRFSRERTQEVSNFARDPQKVLVDQVNMGMPRMSPAAANFLPYSPAAALPYAHHWRLARNPNDTFLAGNTHREGISPFDDLQPAYAALYSGAFHPTAEGHAVVADHVLRHVNDFLEKRALAQN